MKEQKQHKKFKCLKCSKEFLSTPSIRICGECKSKPAYFSEYDLASFSGFSNQKIITEIVYDSTKARNIK